ncbi:MAG: glycerophosphodiester phosphodiesterase [Treponemataceae bacterium]|nr:glycerophosphodiester phosphodiesterase [Treponemataceae bacterium]
MIHRLPLLPEYPRPLIFAHRGCSSLAPENTMEAFWLARQYGAPGIELDIHRCKTGEIVVLHDDTLQRVGNDPRHIEAVSRQELLHIDVGSWKDPSFSHSRVPLLEEVLEEFLPSLYIDIEIKSRSSRDHSLAEGLAHLLKRFGARAHGAVTVSSFNPLALRVFKHSAPDFPTAIIWCNDPELPWYLRRGEGRWLSGCDYLKPRYDIVNRTFLFFRKTLEQRPVVPWTVDDVETAQQLVAMGCSGIITNRPQDIVPGMHNLEKASYD